MDKGLELAITAAGTKTALAERLGITLGAISQWSMVPINRVIEVERATGVNRRDLRPDLFAEQVT